MIALAKPLLGSLEIKAASGVICSGWVIEGPRVKEFEDKFAAFVGSPYAVAVSNCTTALHLALLVSGIKPGDVVITVSHSFVATANSIRYCAAEPVFVDIDRHTYNMDPNKLEECLKQDFKINNGQLYYRHIDQLLKSDTPLNYLFPGQKLTRNLKNGLGRLGAILVVHQMGMPCDLRSILKIAKKHRVKVIEDAACAIGSEISYDSGKNWQRIGKPHADLACFSFHPRKVITTGEGGMITTSNERLAHQLRLLRCHGRNIPGHMRTSYKKTKMEDYTVMGYNYRMTDIQAAIGIVQLERIQEILSHRNRVEGYYKNYLKGIEWIVLPYQPLNVKTNWQSYPVRIQGLGAEARDDLMQMLFKNRVACLGGITNAHQLPPYHKSFWKLPQSEAASQEVVLLPLLSDMKAGQVQKIAKIILDWKKQYKG